MFSKVFILKYHCAIRREKSYSFIIFSRIPVVHSVPKNLSEIAGKRHWRIFHDISSPLREQRIFPEKSYILIAGYQSRKSRLLQINFRIVPKGLCETMLCNYPTQFNILYNVAATDRHYAHRNLRSQPSKHWYTSTIKIARYKVARLYFPCLLFFFVNLFLYSQSRCGPIGRSIATLYWNRPA